jgi:hypothetical protein
LLDVLKVTQTWLAKANADKSGATVLQADVTEALSEVKRLCEGSSADEPRPPRLGAKGSAAQSAGGSEPRIQLESVLRGAILALRDEDTALASVPAVSRKLRASATSAEVIQALLDGFKTGRVELRPEGGIGRLSLEDVALCPKGVGGVPLSWVRLLEGEP